jgi:Zn-dependent protease with chaperone function
VYLVADVNAFVAQRGGWMELFSTRVMGLGLPLLNALTVSELRAVLSHEFGHYAGGDTKLLPWIYRARIAIIRTRHKTPRSWRRWLRRRLVFEEKPGASTAPSGAWTSGISPAMT